MKMYDTSFIIPVFRSYYSTITHDRNWVWSKCTKHLALFLRYVDDLFKLDSSTGSGNLKQFEEVINQETFWVATEILKEPNALKRMKTIKHFIKIALHCRECKNFNSMFAIIRWARLPSCLLLSETNLSPANSLCFPPLWLCNVIAISACPLAAIGLVCC